MVDGAEEAVNGSPGEESVSDHSGVASPVSGPLSGPAGTATEEGGTARAPPIGPSLKPKETRPGPPGDAGPNSGGEETGFPAAPDGAETGSPAAPDGAESGELSEAAADAAGGETAPASPPNQLTGSPLISGARADGRLRGSGSAEPSAPREISAGSDASPTAAVRSTIPPCSAPTCVPRREYVRKRLPDE
ncbi:hypothetical protein GCM10025331_05800 [Actinoplanes utahensis]|nr:hypothetical protein Aut01nite_13060 [Actinoplanes utahensis]